MTVWFTADLHLGHGNIIKYCQRPFLAPEEKGLLQNPRAPGKVSAETVQRHDTVLLQTINAQVGKKDILWILGDFCWGDFQKARSYRDQIQCQQVHLVWGNHDQRSIRPLFGEVLEQGMLMVKGQALWLNHYPMRSWNKSFHGSWHLYGHVHGRLMAEDQAVGHTLCRDVGVDACEYRPMSFEELAGYMAPRVEAFRKRKEEFKDNDG